MEREAVFQFRQFAAIEVIAADRAADMRQMHANLVGAPGLQPQAETAIDAADMVREVGEICQAADLCAADLALIEQDNAPTRLSGTADEAMLDLLSAMMEARASGRQDLALRSLDQAEQYLRMLGVQSVFYDAEHAALFDVLPARSGERTVRPALVRDGELVRRGVAAVAPMAAKEA